MKTVNVPLTTLEILIEDLENSVTAYYNALDNSEEQGYPYATGYMRATIQQTLKNLETLKSQAN